MVLGQEWPPSRVGLLLPDVAPKAAINYRPKMKRLCPCKTITKKKDFDELYLCGRRAGRGSLEAIYGESAQKELKIGLVVTKKQGNAVTRNLARRLFREACRLNQDHIKKGYNVLLIIKAPLPDKYGKAENALLKVLDKATLLEK
ncbi:MAG: ribonuclease P protein component [Actinobacteria bacterium]|nr:MAG: ribonuclease P protein component [Actinomycetota bacterium]